jgi:predicted ATPase
MGINKISIKNFRVFKEKTTFQLRPFTILTGPNNSGKSSLIKFLLLLKEGVVKLNYTTGNHNLEDFTSNLNWEQQEEPLEFELMLNDNSRVNYTYNGSEFLNDIKYLEDDKVIIEFSRKIIKYESDEVDPFDSYKALVSIKLDIDFFIKNALDSEKDIIGMYYDDEMPYDRKVWEEGLLFKLFVKDEDITLNYSKILRELQRNLFNVEYELDVQNLSLDFYELISNQINYLIQDCKKSLIDDFNELSQFQEGDFKIEFSDFGLNLLSSNIFNSSNRDDKNHFVSWILNLLNDKYFTQSVKYLSPDRGNQKRVLMNHSDKDIDSIIVEFSKRKHIHKEFVQKCFQLLGIEGTLEVNRYENTISTVYLKKDDKKLSLADLGFGYSQVIPIILKVHNLIPDSNLINVFENNRRNQSLKKDDFGFLILEEPEANLHPNLQSKLAAVLVFIQKSFNIKFIIETHSEYFLRKLQYLTAKKELKTEDSVIYYFNDDKYVSKTEPKVKEIFINEDGGLTDSFGPGFFDEATKLQFDLIKLNKQQLN